MSGHVIRVVLADDHTLLRQGLLALLAGDDAVRVVAETADGPATVAKVEELQPDVLVLDLSMPGFPGLEVLRRVAKESPRTRVLVLTMHEEHEYVVHAVRAGAHGFLLKDSAAHELLQAVRDLGAGRRHFGAHASAVLAQQVEQPSVPLDDPYRNLTNREREVFHLIIEGATTKEIARKLYIAPRTAENHRNHVLAKLGARNTAGLLRYAARGKLLG